MSSFFKSLTGESKDPAFQRTLRNWAIQTTYQQPEIADWKKNTGFCKTCKSEHTLAVHDVTFHSSLYMGGRHNTAGLILSEVGAGTEFMLVFHPEKSAAGSSEGSKNRSSDIIDLLYKYDWNKASRDSDVTCIKDTAMAAVEKHLEASKTGAGEGKRSFRGTVKE